MRPEEVNPTRFKKPRIVFSCDDFSMAWGSWTGDTPRDCLGIRWDATRRDAEGYPAKQWMMLPEWLSLVIVDQLAKRRPIGCRHQVLDDLDGEIGSFDIDTPRSD